MKTNISFLQKFLFIGVFILSNTLVFAQDSDGDGVLDATETIDGTDHLDTCSYIVTSITEPINFKDCDADGLTDSEEITGIDDAGTPANPNGVTSNPLSQDTDGDGVKDGDEANDGTDPNDFCDYNETSWSVTQSVAFRNFDCDNDGLTNWEEIENIDDSSTVAVPLYLTNPQNSDTDGDGVIDGTETINGTNPINSCDFNILDISLTPTVFCNINTVIGTIQYDQNDDGCDINDLNLANIKITADNGTQMFSTFTQTDGTYILNTDMGNYTISISAPNYYITSPSIATHNFSGNGETFTADFCITSTQVISDVNVNVIPLSSPRPGFTITYRLTYKNMGTTLLNGTVNFEFENSKLTLNQTSVPIDNQTSNNLIFNYNALQPYETRYVDISFTVATIPTVNIGDLLHFTANINPIIGDNTVIDNTLVFDDIVIGSYDPNDIHVLEGYSIKLTDASDYLHYNIRFQNTGTADAQNVLVTNKLDANLDWTTFQLENTSHQGRVAIFDDNQIEFIFENINLPDSTTNEPNSHGYIAYKIKPKSTINIGDSMSNDAKIYFDFNPAILTNIVNTTVENTASVLTNSRNNLSIYPNPTTGIIKIITLENLVTKIELYSKLGHLIVVKEASEIQILDISNIDNGLYFLKIFANNKVIGMKKMIKNK